MAPFLFSIMNRLRRNQGWSCFYAVRSYALQSEARKNLVSRLSALGNYNGSILSELNAWADSVKRVRHGELSWTLRDLRMRRRYAQALEVSEWMGDKCTLNSSDYAVQMDLIARVRGLEAAETYFNSLDDKDKDQKTYGALLNCYVREQLVEKALPHVQKMKELGLANLMSYNDLMRLYSNMGQYDKVPELFAEMKENEVKPDPFSYSICINAYGERSDIEGMERMVEEMKSQEHMDVDWYTYGVMANIYVKVGLIDEAILALKKSEEKLNGDTKREGYDRLIRLYGSLGNKAEVERLWQLLKSCKKVLNKHFMTMVWALVKLDDFSGAESLLKEWEASGYFYDFRVPNMLLIGYCRKDMLEKAESMLEDIMKKGRAPSPSSFGILAGACEERGMKEKALEYMKKALSLHPGNEGWKPKMELIQKLLQWLGDEGKWEEVEPFVGALRVVIPMDRDVYHTLLRVSVREGKEINMILESMKAENIEPDEETEKILRSNDQ